MEINEISDLKNIKEKLNALINNAIKEKASIIGFFVRFGQLFQIPIFSILDE